MHFGFRLRRAEDIERARTAIRDAGGTIKETGEFVPGEPYVFFSDPDGYEVEIWYEIPTPVDPGYLTLFWTSASSHLPPWQRLFSEHEYSNSSPFSISTKVREFLIGFV